MLLLSKIVFWASVAVLFYTYLGYPIVLFVLASVKQTARDLRFIFNRGERRTPGTPEMPGVTLVIPAYNEAEVIGAKLDNSLALDYPQEKLEIVVASDGSTDATNQIVEMYAGRGVKLINYTERGGKVAAINRTVPQASNEIVVLSDANTMYEPDALRNLVRHFSSPEVGVAVGELVFESPSREHKGEGYYWRYEVMLKFMENKLGAILGANGGLYAIRRELFEPVPDTTIVDDFVIPLKIAERGYRQVYTPDARGREETASDVQAELVRRKRIAAGNFQSILMLWRLLNPLRGYIAFTFVSHKILRWTAPFFMATALLSNLVLVAVWPLYSVLLIAQAVFYGSAWLGAKTSMPVLRKLTAMPYYFVSMNMAMAEGFFNFVTSRQKVTWDKIQRQKADGGPGDEEADTSVDEDAEREK